MVTKSRTEVERLAALHALDILDTGEEEHFEAVCRTARRLFGVGTSVVSLIDSDRQWLKTACSLIPRELPRAVTFCDHTIRTDAIFVVEDATKDPRFAGGELIVNAPHIRFYAGAPLILRPGIRVGSFCLIDTVPRAFSAEDEAALRDLAEIVVAHLRLQEAKTLREQEVAARIAYERVIETQAEGLRERERALGDANRLLTLAEEVAQIGHWRVALDDGEPVWSAGAHRIMGTADGSAVPPLSEIAALYHPEDRTRVTAIVRDSIQNGTGFDYDARVLRADGTVRDVSVRGMCENNAYGRAVGLFGTMIDMTARRESEAALAHSEARYRELTEALPLLVWTTRMSDGHATFTNTFFQTYCGTIGPERDAREQRNHPADRERIVEAWKRALVTGTSMTIEGRLRRHDGVYRWHKIVMIPIPQADGSPPKEWLGTALDIDEIVTSRHRLQETTDLLRIAQDAANAGSWDWDMRAGIATLAEESVRLYGLPGDAAMRFTTKQWTELLHPEDRTPTWDSVRRAIETHSVYRADYRVICGPTERWMRASGRAFYDENGRPYRMVGLHFDVTDRKRDEAALEAATVAAEAARREAERSSEAKSDFLAAMSHEIRTPLNGIIGYADLLLEGRHHAPEDRHHLELIQGSGAALLTVVNDVLDFSKIEAGQFDLDPMVFPLHGMIENTVSIVGGAVLKRPLTLSCEIDPALPAFVLGDEGRLRQVLLNLLNNAVKFTPSGSVILRVRHMETVTLPDGDAGDSMRFEVVDTGIGIAPSQRDRLFKRFSQVDGSISRRFGGSGLGLAICRHLVMMMGGEIGVHSREGAGSTFWFTLTLPRREALPALAAPSLEPVDTRPSNAIDGLGRRARLLLVEDVKINQELARAVLEANGYLVDIVDDGVDAIAAVQTTAGGPNAYDVVLMDVQMPGMDGLTATRRIRALAGPASDVPIVAMTANVLPGQVEELYAAGMDDHVGKPFKRAELYTTIDRWIAKRAASAKAMLDRDLFESVRSVMGAERVKALLTMLEAELGARFAVSERTPDPSAEAVAVDRARLAQDAHALVSAAGMLGFVGVAGLCRDIEAACRADAELAPLIERFADVRNDALREIEALKAA